jgi:predicted CopG family antitoxin
MARSHTGKKVTATVRVEPNVRTALAKKHVGHDTYSDVIVRLLGMGIKR